MPFTASNTPQRSPPDVRQPVENAGPDMPFIAFSTLQCPEYTPPASNSVDSQFPLPNRYRADKVTLLGSADTPKSIPRFPSLHYGEVRVVTDL